jgi:hypothetical protein
MARWVRQKYLDLAWWADGVPRLRWMKCVFGRHCPILTFGPNGPTGTEHCAWCEKEIGVSRD